MKQISIRKYGARLIGSDAVIVQSMRDQNRLWNKLVEIERANRTEYREIVTQSDDELAALARRAEGAEQRMEDARRRRNNARQAKRSKNIDGAHDYAAEIRGISGELKTLRERMKICRVRAKEVARPRLEELELRRRDAVKAAGKAAGLWWCHSELVMTAFDTARVKALKTNAELRFHRFDGDGRVGVRFSPGILLANPPDTELLRMRQARPEELGNLQARRAKKRIVAVDMRVGKPGEQGEIPVATFLVTIHDGMEILPNAPLKTIIAKREVRAGAPNWFMVFMFVDPDAEHDDKPLPPKAVGIDFGWRVVRDREWGDQTGLRVATVAGSDGERRHITIPPELIARFAWADRLRGELDASANDFWTRTSPLLTDAALESMSEDEWLRVLVGKARRAKRPYPSLMLALAAAHNKTPALGEKENARMQAWARAAHRKNVAVFGARRRAMEHRKHIYHNEAARLVREHGLLAVKDTDLAQLARLVNPDGTETELNERARANRFIASPSELRNAIRMAAQRERRELVDVDPTNTTVTCAQCGHVHTGPITDLVFVCEGCAAVHDQDENSAAFCLKTAIESTGKEG